MFIHVHSTPHVGPSGESLSDREEATRDTRDCSRAWQVGTGYAHSNPGKHFTGHGVHRQFDKNRHACFVKELLRSQ